MAKACLSRCIAKTSPLPKETRIRVVWSIHAVGSLYDIHQLPFLPSIWVADLACGLFAVQVTLNQRELTLRELFEEFDTDGSGFMSHDEFTEFMKSLPVRLRYVVMHISCESLTVGGR
jgi:hypothetical protein